MAQRVKFYPSEVAKLLKSNDGPVFREIQRKTLLVHGRAVKGCPVKTGRLRSSIRWQMGQDGKGVFGLVGTDVNYAIWVHDGTRPHTIRATNKRALYWKGARHPVKSVQHPGTKAVPFLLDSLKAVA